MARVSDLYVKAALAVIAVALVMLAVNPWITTAQVLKEGAPPEPQQPQAIPKAWGRVAGVTVDRSLVFEGPDGTVRFVTFFGRLGREIKRN